MLISSPNSLRSRKRDSSGYGKQGQMGARQDGCATFRQRCISNPAANESDRVVIIEQQTLSRVFRKGA